MAKRQTTSLRLIPNDLSESLGKVPPQALDLEEAVLGACMLESSALTQVIDILQEEDFYSEQHRGVWVAILSLYKKQAPVDMRTVVIELRETGKLELIGGAYRIAELTAKVTSAANVEYHARKINEFSIKRQLIHAASQIHQIAYEDEGDVFELMDSVQAQLDVIAGNYLKTRARKAKVIYDESIQKLLVAMKKEGIVGVPSGLFALDRLTGGWQAPNLIIIAGRPAMGKTAFVCCAARNAAVDFKIPTAIFSLEMSSVQLMDRLIAGDAEVDLDNIIKGRIADHELSQISHKTGRLASAPLYIDDTPALSVLEFRAKCRRMKAEHDIQLIIVDYLQLMRGSRDANNREQEIASITGTLKAVAKELNTPVLALSQLSRAVETRGGDKRPQLSDLRESGAIEQDADIVGFLYRAEYYKITVFDDGMPTHGVMEVIIAKNRNGRCETVPFNFVGRYCKVSNFEAPPSPVFEKQKPLPSYKEKQAGMRELVEREEPNSDDLPF